MRALALAIACIVLALTAFADDAPPSLVYVECPIVEEAPVIDGKLDDACWQAAPRLTDFARFAAGDIVPVQTEVAVVCDASNLYVAVRAIEPTPEAIVAKYHGRDEPISRDDALEIFIDATHDHQRYVQIVVNSAGAISDSKNKDKSWDADVQAKAKVGPGEWTAEVAITFESLGIQPGPGLVLGANFCRDDAVRKVWSSWAPMKGSFHRPAWFGHLVLGDALAQAVRRIHDDLPHPADRPITLETADGTLVLAGSAARIGALVEALAPRVRSLRARAGAMSRTAFDRDTVAKRADAALAEYDAIVPVLTSAPETVADALRLRRRLESLSLEITGLEMSLRLAAIFAR